MSHKPKPSSSAPPAAPAGPAAVPPAPAPAPDEPEKPTESTFVSPKGHVYRIIHTREVDDYQKPGQTSGEKPGGDSTHDSGDAPPSPSSSPSSSRQPPPASPGG